MATSPIRHQFCRSREQGRPPFPAARSIRPPRPPLLLLSLVTRLVSRHLGYVAAVFLDARTFITATAQTMRVCVYRLARLRLLRRLPWCDHCYFLPCTPG